MLGSEGADPATSTAAIQNGGEMLRAPMSAHSGGGPRQSLDRPDSPRRSEGRLRLHADRTVGRLDESLHL